MNARNRRQSIAAIITLITLAGMSFVLFPAHTIAESPAGVAGATGVSGPTGARSSTGACYPPQNIIVLKADGSVNSTAIQRHGNTYTLTRDIINQTIFVEKSNVLLNGENHAVILKGINIDGMHGVTIANFNFSHLDQEGIYITNGMDIIIQNNNFTDVSTGVSLHSSNSCRVILNNFNCNTAIFSAEIKNSTVSRNTFRNCDLGTNLLNSDSCRVTDNLMIGTLDPIYAGTNATIGGNTLINGTEAIFVDSQNRVYNNTIANFSSGITIRGINSLICLNTITNCSNAVSFFGSNDYFPLGNNLIWYNSFVNNSKLVALYLNSSLSINRWDNGKEGNYWSSYNGSDGNGDGIGDTPYILAANCTDNYPLIQPYTMASAGVVWGNMFFAAATVTALAGAAVIICVYTKFRERS